MKNTNAHASERKIPRVNSAIGKRLLIAWLGAGTLDISYAFIASGLRGRSPLAVLQSVASGWQGKEAYNGGLASAALGLFTHYGIMLVMVSVFVWITRTRPALLRKSVITGAVYGLGLYAVMYGIVLPLRFPEVFPRWSGWLSVTDILVHMGVGLIMALVLAGKKVRGADSR
ncbi:hypothetical protein [Dokdonella sp.]|uniref:hypothetical protein n=1 Tax=Dokdonella sp. TaxID=2291710 RepID=UPI0037832558